MRMSLAILTVLTTMACSSESGLNNRALDAGGVDLRASSQRNDTAGPSLPSVSLDTAPVRTDTAPPNTNPSRDAGPGPHDTASPPRDIAAPRLDASSGRPDTAGVIGTPVPNSWLFVVRSLEEPTPGEKALIEHSEKVGSPLVALAIRSFTNSESEAKAATNYVWGRKGVVISNAASGNAVIATKYFQSMPVAVITLSERSYNSSGESAWLVPVSIASASKGAGRQDGTQVTVTGTHAELSAGLTGAVTVSSSAMLLGWGIPRSSSAIIVATLAVPAGAAAIFAYPRGATLDDGSVAPGPRAGFFFDCIAGTNMTADGFKLWDALLDWASKQ